MLRFSISLLCIAVALIVGCALPSRDSNLPVARELVCEQLIVHSDFYLPRHHRLLDDLVARRTDIENVLEIAVSDEPIHVYLFADQDDFQRFMSRNHPGFPHRRAFFVKNDTMLMVYAYWGERVAEDLRHEVTHGYLHSVVPEVPLWLDEGIAEYFETSRGSNGVNSPHVKLLAEAYRKSEWQPNLQRLESLESTATMSQLDYAESWLWVHFLLHRDAQTNALLCQSLADCRKSGIAPPLSPQIDAYLPQGSTDLLAHLKALANE